VRLVANQLYPRRQLLAQGVAELAGGSGEQDLHSWASFSEFRDRTEAKRAHKGQH
jgi:hypothetical protein